MIAVMNDRVAVRADWDEVLYRINLVSCPNLGERDDVMYMNKSDEFFPISNCEIKATDSATGSVMLNGC